MEVWIVWAVVLAIASIATLGLRSLRQKADKQPATHPSVAHGATSAPHATAAPAINALTLARRLGPLYEACAHPSDLLGRPEFEEGVAALCDGSVPVEQLINYCLGSNEELSVLASEA